MDFSKFAGVHYRNRVEAYMRKFGKSKFFDFDYPDDKREEGRKYVSNCKKYAVWIYEREYKDLQFALFDRIEGKQICTVNGQQAINERLEEVMKGLK